MLMQEKNVKAQGLAKEHITHPKVAQFLLGQGAYEIHLSPLLPLDCLVP